MSLRFRPVATIIRWVFTPDPRLDLECAFVFPNLEYSTIGPKALRWIILQPRCVSSMASANIPRHNHPLGLKITVFD